MSIKILLVDDHEIMCEGLNALLRRQEDMDVVGQATNGRDAIKLAHELSPDIIVMDVEMPNLNGIEATRQIVSECPGTKVMALSTHSHGDIVAKMLKAGASGYILKDSAFAELVDGINAICDNKTYLCTRITKVVFNDYVSLLSNPRKAEGNNLTNREREVLQLVAEGNTTKGIAALLKVSTKTIDSHREHIMDKLGIRNVAGLTRFALREGLTFF